MKSIFTGMYDDDLKPIFLGSKLQSNIWCDVIVDEVRRSFVGMFVFENTSILRDIPYHLNGGRGFKVADR
jgi:hypothetical protein